MKNKHMLLRISREMTRDLEVQRKAPRSPLWAKLREKFIADNSSCMACGQRDDLSVHHIRPFHLFPELELEPTNLVTLCEKGPGSINCHLVIGHGGNWSRYNLSVVQFARTFFEFYKEVTIPTPAGSIHEQPERVR